MIFVIGKPVSAINVAMASYLANLSGANSALIGIIIGLMMASDMGGPINKAAYAFGVGTLGAAFITEGAIPFAAADPFKIIPSTMVGAAVAGSLSMVFKAGY